MGIESRKQPDIIVVDGNMGLGKTTLKKELEAKYSAQDEVKIIDFDDINLLSEQSRSASDSDSRETKIEQTQEAIEEIAQDHRYSVIVFCGCAVWEKSDTNEKDSGEIDFFPQQLPYATVNKYWLSLENQAEYLTRYCLRGEENIDAEDKNKLKEFFAANLENEVTLEDIYGKFIDREKPKINDHALDIAKGRVEQLYLLNTQVAGEKLSKLVENGTCFHPSSSKDPISQYNYERIKGDDKQIQEAIIEKIDNILLAPPVHQDFQKAKKYAPPSNKRNELGSSKSELNRKLLAIGLSCIALSIAGGIVAGNVFGTIVQGMLTTALAYSGVAIAGIIGIASIAISLYQKFGSERSFASAIVSCGCWPRSDHNIVKDNESPHEQKEQYLEEEGSYMTT